MHRQADAAVAAVVSLEHRSGAWKQLGTEAEQLASYGASASYWPEEDALLVLGGCSTAEGFSRSLRTFSFREEAWAERELEELPARHFHAAAVVGTQLVAFGGKSNGYRHDLLVLDLKTGEYEMRSPAQGAVWPIARYGHSAVAYGGYLYIFGGYDRDGFTCDNLHSYDPKKNKWRLHKSTAEEREILGRFHHSAVVHGASMLVFGGKRSDLELQANTLLEYHFHTKVWTELRTVGLAPTPRWGHCAALSRGKMYVFGGSSGSNALADLYEYDVASRSWAAVEVSWCPAPRYFSAAADVAGALHVFGGKSATHCFGDLYCVHVEGSGKKKKERKEKKKKESSGIGSGSSGAGSGSVKKRRRRRSSKAVGAEEEWAKLKCVYGEEIRIIPLRQSTSYEELVDHLAHEYSTQWLCVQYKDSEGDMITVRSQSDLGVMLETQGGSTVRVYLSEQALSSHSSQSGSAPALPAMEQPGERELVKHWRVTATELGHGAFGCVFLGMNTDTGELIAVKQVKVAGTNEEQAKHIRLLQREIEVMLELDHPNIVRYLGSEKEEQTLSIFLEYVPGGSIHSLLQKFKRFGESVIRAFVKQILQGLAYLHHHRIVHRDIKGANILVDNDGSIKLADFGAAKQLADIVSYTNTVTGTPYWMAPEMIQGDSHYGRKADIWSVGAVVVEMASGKPPFYELPPLTALFKLGSTDVVPDVPPELSDSAKDFLGRCFQRDPEVRASAKELLEHPFISEGDGDVQETEDNMYSADLGSMITFLQEHSIVSLQGL